MVTSAWLPVVGLEFREQPSDVRLGGGRADLQQRRFEASHQEPAPEQVKQHRQHQQPVTDPLDTGKQRRGLREHLQQLDPHLARTADAGTATTTAHSRRTRRQRTDRPELPAHQAASRSGRCERRRVNGLDPLVGPHIHNHPVAVVPAGRRSPADADASQPRLARTTRTAGFRLGVDFDTSNTVALSSPDGRIGMLLFDRSPLLASAVLRQVADQATRWPPAAGEPAHLRVLPRL